MAARPSWRGQIRLALVSIPVEIFPATKAGRSIAFHQVHEPSGQRVRYEKVVPGIGPVDRDEILKGYEVEKGEYVLLDPEEIEKVKLESRKTLELTQFVDLPDIALEVVYTSGGIDKLHVYLGLGVREVWFYQDGVFQLHELSAGSYQPIVRSRFIPELDFEVLARFVRMGDQHAAVKAYRDWLRGG